MPTQNVPIDKKMLAITNYCDQVYGYNIMVCDKTKGKDKQFVVSNILPFVKDPSESEQNEIADDVDKILLLLILSHIFMSSNNVSDVSLYSFLKTLNIDVDLKHPIFGNVKDYVTKDLIKKQYLISEIDTISRKQTFKWGIRAEKEISKMAVLKFVCKVYKDKQPKDWVNQYRIAKEQAYENHPEGSFVIEHDSQ